MKPTFKMDDARFGALVAFACVAEEKSFTLAARRLRVSPSAVSQAVRRLEERIGATLLVRTSRRVELSDAGADLLARAVPALSALTETLDHAARESDAVRGTLRISCPNIAAPLMPPIVRAYLEANAEARVEIVVDDRKVDLVAEGFDAGVRLEESIPAEMIAVRIAEPFRFVVVASPDYLASRGVPRTIRDLGAHACIAMRTQTTETLYRWELERRGRVVRFDAPSRLVVDSMALAIACARAGMGLAYTDEPGASSDLARGDLAIVLERFAAHVPGFYFYFPQASRSAPRVRALVAASRSVTRPPATRGAAASPRGPRRG